MSDYHGALVPGCGARGVEWWVELNLKGVVAPGHVRNLAHRMLASADLADSLTKADREASS